MMDILQIIISSVVSLIVGGGLSTLITMRFFIKKQKLDVVKNETDAHQVQVEYFEKRITSLITQLDAAQDAFDKTLEMLCENCTYKIYYLAAKKRLDNDCTKKS
jgi:hypothetical protein